MANVNISNVFPCAQAPFDEGKHRLWTESNITKFIRLIFDTNNSGAQYGEDLVYKSADGKTLIIYGYVFDAPDGEIFGDGPYYICIKNNELVCKINQDPQEGEADWEVLFDSTTQDPPFDEGVWHGGHTVTPIKILQSQLPNIDLNI